MKINETFEQLVEGKHPKSFLEQNPGQLAAIAQKHMKDTPDHLEQQIRYRLRMHEPTASGATIRKVVRKAIELHRGLRAAEAAKKAKTAKKAKK